MTSKACLSLLTTICALMLGVEALAGVQVVSLSVSERMAINTPCANEVVLPGTIKEIFFSNLWKGEEHGESVLRVNGQEVARQSGEGVFTWQAPSEGDDYILTLTVEKDGSAVGTTEMRAYTVPSLEEATLVSSAVQKTGVRIDTRAGNGPIETDQAEEITFSGLWAGDEGATATVTVNGAVVQSATGEGVYHWPLPSTGGEYRFTLTTTKDGASVGDVLTATFVVTSHDIAIDDGTGGQGGKESRFSYSGVYDGIGHGIAVEVTGVAEPEIRYALAQEGPYCDTLLLTNVCHETAMWYTVSASGYNTYTNWATVTIAKRPVTFTAPTKNKVYDGTPLTFGADEITVSGDGYASGECLEYSDFASITGVGEIGATFRYRDSATAKAANYAVTVEEGTLTVTPAALDRGAVFGGVPGAGTEEDPLVCERVFHGEAQGLALKPDLGGEAYRFLYALASDGAYSETSPTRTNVADGDLRFWFRLESPNFEPLGGVAVLRIAPRTVTEEMLAYGDDAFFYDGENTKVPDVILADTNALGTVISTAADYTRAYGERLATGEYPVTVTGRNNYRGTVTKAFAVLKRPVTPPVIGSLAYNGKTRKATVPTDARWTVVRNDGGVDAGDYPVVLRLTNAEDYRWAGQGEDETDWTGVFTIRRAANGWSVRPGIAGWDYGETPGEPVARARYGEWSVAYRRKGADVASETSERPSLPGDYIARFWVEEQGNYAAVASAEVEFTVGRGSYAGGDHTETTPEPVPHAWLDKYLAAYGGGDYETAGHATGRNGVALWASYVAGLDPEDPASRFTAEIRIGADGRPVVTWTPDLSKDAEAPRVYTVYGKARLGDAEWTPVKEAGEGMMRFFKVEVRLGR